MATQTTVTVKTSGGDYTSLNGAEAGEQADLPTADVNLTIECYAMSDTAAVDFDGWTTDATRMITVTVPVAERHSGVYDAAKYVKTNGHGTGFDIHEAYVDVVGVQFTGDNNYATGACVDINGDLGVSSVFNFEKCLFVYLGADGFGTYGLELEFLTGPDQRTLYMRNCLFYDWDGASAIRNIDDEANWNAYVFNCTFQNNVLAVASDANLKLMNCLFSGNTTDFSGTIGSGSDYNATNNASLGYTANTNDRVSQTFTFDDAGGDDFHLDPADAGALDFGVDLSADADQPFSDDIEGTTRSGTWDIGCFNAVAAAAANQPYQPWQQRGPVLAQ